MKKLCRNCGAKVPKKSDICKKCGEPYEYIDLIRLDPEAEKALQIDNPKVAILAATEQMLPGMQACVDAAIISKMIERGQIPGCVGDGPLALDVAISKEAASIKKLTSPVAGDADCLVFPNIESANVFYKVNSQMCKGVDQAAIVAGAMAPCVLSSRADSIETKLNSIALAALTAK